jgi:gas vesicle protein
MKKSGMPGLSMTQDVLQSSLSAAQDVLEKNVKSAQKDLKKSVKSAQKNLKKVGESVQDVQDTVSHSASKFFFRLGLVTGLVAILLYTPWPGSEIRQKLADRWQQLRQNISSRTSAS